MPRDPGEWHRCRPLAAKWQVRRVKVVTVVGARPQFIKCAPVSRALRTRFHEVLVHTGQHYDDEMSGVFFRELGIPRPDHDLGVGSGSHGAQTGAMLAAIEKVIMAEQPDWVITFGDTNSTLAGALAAVKLHVPVAHVEAGVRSFNWQMPEEVNRVLTDRISRLRLCPTPSAVDHLRAEGITEGVRVVGDVMYDALLAARARSASNVPAAAADLAPGSYWLATVHRAENTDDITRLRGIIDGLSKLDGPVILPLHPRTKRILGETGLLERLGPNVRLIEPQGYFSFVALLAGARLLLTDSGGAQKEAFLLGIPCVTLRDETEWTETVEVGRNRLVGADPRRIVEAASAPFPPLDPQYRPYGDGQAASRIAECLAEASK